MGAEKLLMTSDAARLLNRSAELVRGYERSGQLRARKTTGGHRLFRECDVRRLAAELEAKRNEAAAIRQKLGIRLDAPPPPR